MNPIDIRLIMGVVAYLFVGFIILYNRVKMLTSKDEKNKPTRAYKIIEAVVIINIIIVAAILLYFYEII